MSCIYILDINLLLVISFASIFSIAFLNYGAYN